MPPLQPLLSKTHNKCSTSHVCSLLMQIAPEIGPQCALEVKCYCIPQVLYRMKICHKPIKVYKVTLENYKQNQNQNSELEQMVLCTGHRNTLYTLYLNCLYYIEYSV